MMRLFIRAAGVICLAYALMLFQANPAQGTLSYIRETWGNESIWVFILWFLVSGFYLLFFCKSIQWFFVASLPQIAYSMAAAVYVFKSVAIGGNAQWGAFTTHGSGSLLLLAIIWYFHHEMTNHDMAE